MLIPPGDIDATKNKLRDHYHSVLEHGKVIFFIIDANGDTEYVSDYVREILNFTPDVLIGKSIFNISDPESILQLKRLIEGVRKQHNQPVHFQDLGLFCTHCYRHYFDGLILNIDSAEGEKFAIYLHDVTVRKTEAEKLAMVNLELDSFIYKASHDLRAPLLSIAGLIDLSENCKPSEQINFLRQMKRSVDRLDKFISQLAQYTKNNYVTAQYTVIDFNELFTEIVETCRYLPNAEKINFSTSIETCEPVGSDSFRLKVILYNIVTNAVKYHNIRLDDPLVSVSMSGDRKTFSISIADNGPGIAPENHEKIFDMFTRASDKVEGSGLGLYIVKKALERLNGTVKVRSELGAGTTFEISIPNEIDSCLEIKKS